MLKENLHMHESNLNLKKFWHSVQSILRNPSAFPGLFPSPLPISRGNAAGNVLLTNHQTGGRVADYE